jgi:hypothetical protein
MVTHMSLRTVAACVTGLVLVAGCSSSGTAASPSPTNSRPAESVVDGLSALPDDKATDWTSYAQQVSVVEVVSEIEQPAAPDLVLRGEYTTTRSLQLRLVENAYVLPGGTASIQPGSLFSILTDGWAYSKERGRLPERTRGSVRLETGKRYVMAIGREGSTWFSLTAETAVPVQSGVVEADPVQSNPVAAQLDGMRTDQLDEFFAAHPVESLARKYADRDGIARYRAVLAERAKG